MTSTASGNRVLVVGALSILGAFVAFCVVLWETGALVFTGGDPSAKVVSATVALVGTFLGAIVSLLGLLFKHSMDVRTEARLEAEAGRNEAMQREAEERLKLEAAIRAVELFGTQSGNPTLPIQRAGALITLSSLGQHALALTLAGELLEGNAVSSATVATIIDRAIRFGDKSVQRDATDMVLHNAAKFVTRAGVELPSSLVMDSSTLPPHVRCWIPDVYATVLISRPLKQWRTEFVATAHGLVLALCRAYLVESDADIRRDIAAVLREAIPMFPKLLASSSTSFLGAVVDSQKLYDEVANAVPATDTLERLLVRFKTWADDA